MGTLMRSRVDRKIAGVCGGIARNQGWDSNVVRLIWVALVLFAGTGVLAYIVLWVVLPEEPVGLPPYAGYAPPQPGYAPPGYGTGPAGAYPPAQGYAPPQPGPYPGGQTYQGQGGQTYPAPGAPPQGPQNG